ncbi:MAG TPA: hypothetical protein VL625_04980 [Patescibacteria group bacterium]|nr:hypothetical protein [Patescibacteria group bacterium]
MLQACVDNRPAESQKYDPLKVGSNPELQKLIGKKVTLRGTMNVGVQADGIVHNGEEIYLDPDGKESFDPKLGNIYGADVNVTGTLHFHHFDPCPPKVECWQIPPDYYYFDGKIVVQLNHKN